MSQIDGFRRYLDAGVALGQITRARAEEAVRDLIQAGELESNRAQEWVENIVTSSRDRYEAFVATVRHEVRNQLKEVGFTNIDELAHRVATILERGQAAARKAARRPAKSARGAAKKTTKKAQSASRTTAKKAAKKTAAKKTAAKKTASRSTASKKATKRTAAKRPRATTSSTRKSSR